MNSGNIITTVAEYVTEVQKLNMELSTKSNQNLFWFRGESNNGFANPLVPGSYRILANSYQSEKSGLRCYSETVHKLEKNIDADFFRKGHQYLKELNVESNLLNRYFIMQHYGIPTRLLDWSENALVALFFAVSSKDNHNDGVVYILEPCELNNCTVQNILNTEKEFKKIPTTIDSMEKKELLNLDGELRINELYRRYLKMDFCNKVGEDEVSYFPLAITPPPLEKRMLTQSGSFTIFGNEIKGLIFNDKKEQFLRKVIIQKENKKSILIELDQLGINENSIYSDLDGLGSYLKRKYADEFRGNTDLLKQSLGRYNN